jgi:hypothetical protein
MSKDEIANIGESAEELTERNRLQSLFDARDQAAEAIREAPLREYEIQRYQAPKEVIDEHVRAAVTAYALECEPLFKNTNEGLRYWKQYDLPGIQLPEAEPDEIQNDKIGPNVRNIEIEGVPDSMFDRQNLKIKMTGIESYVTLRSPIKIHWSGYGEHGYRLQRREVTTTMGVPRSLSEDVFRATNKLLADLNIGLDAEQIEDSEASYDYSDLL